MAATWKVTTKKNTYKAIYSGDLHEALEKAKFESIFRKIILGQTKESEGD